MSRTQGGPNKPGGEISTTSFGGPFERICEELGLPTETLAEFRATSVHLRHRMRLFDGMERVLRILYEMGVPMSVLTGKDRPRIVQLLDAFALSAFFVAVATPDDPPAAKPAPDGVHWLCPGWVYVPRTAW